VVRGAREQQQDLVLVEGDPVIRDELRAELACDGRVGTDQPTERDEAVGVSVAKDCVLKLV
jgi:hypothetical protein